jgi:hypothetical protein
MTARLLLFAVAFGAIVVVTPFLPLAARALGLQGPAAFLASLGVVLVLTTGLLIGAYWLGRSAALPASEPIDESRETPEQVALMRAFDFTRADLERNREGRLSTRQQRQRGFRRQAFVIIGALATVVICLSLAFVAFDLPTLITGSAPTGDSMLGILVGGAIVLVIFGGSMVYALVSQWNALAGRVSVVEGEVAPSKGHRNVAAPFVRVGKVNLPLYTDAQQRALVAGGRARVFYLASSPVVQVLSVEALPANRA